MSMHMYLVAILFFVLGGAGALRPVGPPRSPLAWRDVVEATVVDSSHALDIANRILGASNARPEHARLVRFTDRDAFGEPLLDRLVWLVRFPEVHLYRATTKRDSCRVDLTAVVDGTDGRFLEAFTPSRDSWTLPFSSPGDPEGTGPWTVSARQSTDLKRSLVAVLEETWNHVVPSPDQCGQVILRPRHVALPGVKMNDGRGVAPVRPAERWLVHVLGIDGPELVGAQPVPEPNATGVKTAVEGPRPYSTGWLILIDDASGRYMMAASTD